MQPNDDRQVHVDPTPYSKPDFREIHARLTTEQMIVTQACGTEQPGTGEYWKHFEPGLYVDIVTGEPLFTSTDKFNSPCGWPSFSKPIDPDVIVAYEDTNFDMYRIEVRSRVGDTHLGHVFDDGPAELGGLRYCINSASLRFVPLDEMDEQGYGEFKSLCK